MVQKEEHMLKFYLTFSINLLPLNFLYSQDTTTVIEKDTLENIPTIINIDQENIIYPGKPLIMSLILPGSGQYYNKSPIWKVASFLGIELGSIVAWNYFKNEAERIRKENQTFADQNWSLENWVMNRFDIPTHVHETYSWTNFPALTKLNGTHDITLIISGDLANDLNLTRVSSDSLEIHPEWFYSGDIVEVRDRHFYENIGKYDQFLGGWKDARNSWYWEEKDVGDSIEIVIKTPLKQSFIDQRYLTNQLLNAAKYSITALMFNHVISGVESVWSSQRSARKDIKQTYLKPKLNLVYNPKNKNGIGGLQFSLFF